MKKHGWMLLASLLYVGCAFWEWLGGDSWHIIIDDLLVAWFIFLIMIAFRQRDRANEKHAAAMSGRYCIWNVEQHAWVGNEHDFAPTTLWKNAKRFRLAQAEEMVRRTNHKLDHIAPIYAMVKDDAE